MYQSQNDGLTKGNGSRTDPRFYFNHKSLKDAGEEPNPLVFCKIIKMSSSKEDNKDAQHLNRPSTSTMATSQESHENKRVGRRQRGRPRGNPPKLTPEQKRQRNAQLERERRAELNDAYEDLQSAIPTEYRAPFAADAEGDIELSRNNLLKSAIWMINQEADISEEKEQLRNGIDFLKNEIEMFQRLLQEQTKSTTKKEDPGN